MSSVFHSASATELLRTEPRQHNALLDGMLVNNVIRQSGEYHIQSFRLQPLDRPFGS